MPQFSILFAKRGLRTCSSSLNILESYFHIACKTISPLHLAYAVEAKPFSKQEFVEKRFLSISGRYNIFSKCFRGTSYHQTLPLRCYPYHKLESLIAHLFLESGNLRNFGAISVYCTYGHLDMIPSVLF